MHASDGPADQERNRPVRFGETVRRAFAEFLKVPILIVTGFLLLAAGTTVLDFADLPWLHPLRADMRGYFFRNAQATSDLLATIAGSIITVISIIFSMLLLAVQQAASALTHQVYDQFLRRRVNQVYFGFFIGLAVYSLIILATVDEPYNPVFGATVALLLTLVALTLIILLLYTTINQMRPVVVIETIHDHALAARECQRAWLARTRSAAKSGAIVQAFAKTVRHGYVVGVDVAAIGAAATNAQQEVEVVLRVSIGAFVAFQDTLAEIRSDSSLGIAEIAEAVQKAFRIEQQRDLDTDAAYGIEQLAIIGWTSVSTAKSNPSPGLLAVHSLRDLVARWSAEQIERAPGAVVEEKIPVVYTDDVFERLLNAFETLAVVASESMQPQTAAEVVGAFAYMVQRLPAGRQQRVDDLIRRSLSTLGEHVLTSDLNEALAKVVRALDAAGRGETAAEVRVAHEALRATVGKLGSRATRASPRN